MVMEWIFVWHESILIWDDLNATFESFMVKSQEAELHEKVCARVRACLFQIYCRDFNIMKS